MLRVVAALAAPQVLASQVQQLQARVTRLMAVSEAQQAQVRLAHAACHTHAVAAEGTCGGALAPARL